MNYNKEFLVPYLESICALYMADRKVQEEKKESADCLVRLKKGWISENMPIKPKHRETITLFRMLCFAYSAIMGIWYLKVFIDELSRGVLEVHDIILSLLTGALVFILPAIIVHRSIKKDEEYNRLLDKEYNEEIELWKERKNENEKKRDEYAPGLQNYIALCDDEHEKIQHILNQVYSTNIIPSQYRNMYVAVYLYDYFRTSQSTDLERALTLFVLEEIKSRLDTIIQQQSEMILNQQMMIAEQRKTREQQERYAKQMIAKLDNIAASNEERNTYLDMIEANTRATAYFAAAEYLK